MNEESLFAAALEINDDVERKAFLDRECWGNDAQREQIEELVAAYESTSNPLDRPIPMMTEAFQPSEENHETVTEKPGTMVGSYKLMEEIGEVGFGLVFGAQRQEPFRQKVALKVIKPGMDTREVIARFEAERQALALMDHPHIAKVLDAGTTDSGRPYFATQLHVSADFLYPRRLYHAACDHWHSGSRLHHFRRDGNSKRDSDPQSDQSDHVNFPLCAHPPHRAERVSHPIVC